MNKCYETGDLGRIYYVLMEVGSYCFSRHHAVATWWNDQHQCYDSAYQFSDPLYPHESEPLHISRLIGRPVYLSVSDVNIVPDRIPARSGSPLYSSIYSERFLEGLEEIGVSVPHQEVAYGLPTDPFTAEERAMLKCRYYVIWFEQPDHEMGGSQLHRTGYHGEADLFLAEHGMEAFTHPVMEMVYRKKLTGFDEVKNYVRLVRAFISGDVQGISSTHYDSLPDPRLKDKSWPGMRLDYMLANGYRL